MKVFRQQDPCVDGKQVALPNVVYDLPQCLSACGSIQYGPSPVGYHREEECSSRCAGAAIIWHSISLLTKSWNDSNLHGGGGGHDKAVPTLRGYALCSESKLIISLQIEPWLAWVVNDEGTRRFRCKKSIVLADTLKKSKQF